ncbi:unnamed protein product, partial [Mesorhabditis spiculigera]
MLPSHAQTTIVKMIWDKKLYPGLTKEGHEVVRQQIGLLSRCGLVEEANSKPRLLKAFRDAYLKASVLGAYGCAGLRAVSEGDEKKAKKDITKNSTERWELVLRPVQQMWTYMIEYFKFERHGTNDVVETSEIGGRPFYLEDSWTERQLEIVMHLREIGLVYIRKRKDGHFYLSPLLCNPTIPSDDIDTSMQRREGMSRRRDKLSRLRVHGIQLAAGHLVDIYRIFVQVGITAQQIVSYLRMNAHRQSLSRFGPILCVF